MEIVKRLYLEKTEKDSFQKTPCVIAMGTFDGLHKGHRDVIDAAAAYARKNLMRLAVFTFSNHPYAAIRPSAIPQALISPEEKIFTKTETVQFFLPCMRNEFFLRFQGHREYGNVEG